MLRRMRSLRPRRLLPTLVPSALLALSLLAALAGCEGACPTSESIVVGGEDYCGASCATCGACGDGFSCQFRGGRGVCVDEAFLIARGVSTSCVDPCPSGEARYEGACARICNVDGECDRCCVEPAGIEFRICAPTPDLCP